MASWRRGRAAAEPRTLRAEADPPINTFVPTILAAANSEAKRILASHLDPAGEFQHDVTITLTFNHGRQTAPLRANSVIEHDSHLANAKTWEEMRPS